MDTALYPEPIAETLQLVGHEPDTVEATHVPMNLLENLVLKVLYLAGELTLPDIAQQTHLNACVVFEIFEDLRKEQFIEAVGMDAGSFRVVATMKGQTEARHIMSRDMYAGPAPVSLADYTQVTRAQSLAHVEVHRPDLHKAFENLVLSDGMIDQLGAALVSGQSIILHGPTGTGKTVVAETLPRIYKDSVWIPHAIEVQGQIIKVFDPLVHKSREEVTPAECDRRWVLCRRPRVMVGGELTMELLDLQFIPALGFYSAPLQMKSNNGVLIVDDFGRQRVSPAELLNRWIVPLERRIDFLTLVGGNAFEIPFDVIVAFSTNLDPNTLADEAFMRRIQTKVKVGYATIDQFHEIARRFCAQSGMAYDAAAVDGLIETLAELGQPLRACYPRDVIQHICWKAKYEGRQPNLTVEGIREACHSYFLPPSEDT